MLHSRTAQAPWSIPIRALLRATASGLAFAWLLSLVLFGQPNVAPHVYAGTSIVHGLYALLALTYAAYLLLQRRLPGRTPIDWAVLLIIAAYGAGVAFSTHQRVSLEATLLIGTAVVVFYAVHDLRFVSVETLARSLAGVAAIAALFALADVLSQELRWLRLVGDIEGGFSVSQLLPPTVLRSGGVADHPNVLGMTLEVCLPFALLLAIRPWRGNDRLLGVVASLLMLTALFFTLSRGAWLGTAAALALLFLLAPRRDLSSRWTSRLSLPFRVRGLPAMLLTIVLLVGIATAAFGLYQARPGWLFRDTASTRFDEAATTLRILGAHPIFGGGPYTHTLLYDSYGGTNPLDKVHPHNAYLTLLGDLGIAGAIAVAIAGLIVARALRRAFLNAWDEDRWPLAACLASVAALLVHGLVDSPNAWSAVLLPLAVVMAIAMRLAPALPPMPRTLGRAIKSPAWLPRLAVLALLPAIGAAWYVIDSPHTTYDASLRLMEDKRFDDAAIKAVTAAEADPGQAAYLLNAGVSQALAYQSQIARDAEPDPALLGSAIDYLQGGVRLEPDGSLGYVNLALAYQLANDPASAADTARIALTKAPYDGQTAGIAASVLEWAGVRDEAVQAYTIALKLNPRLTQSPFWGASPERLDLRLPAIEAAGLTPCVQGRVAAIYQRYGDDLAALEQGCRAIVAASPASVQARADLSLLLFALGRDDEAQAEAIEALALEPGNPSAMTALAASLLTKDIERARHELLRAIYIGDADAKLLLAYSYQPPAPNAPVSERLRAITGKGPLPAALEEMLRQSVTVTDGDVPRERSGRYTLSRLYYRFGLLREPPAYTIIPGDWLQLASPRPLLMLDLVPQP